VLCRRRSATPEPTWRARPTAASRVATSQVTQRGVQVAASTTPRMCRSLSSRSVERTTPSRRRRLQALRDGDSRATRTEDSTATSATARTISSRMSGPRVSLRTAHTKKDGGFSGARNPFSWGQVLGTGSGQSHAKDAHACPGGDLRRSPCRPGGVLSWLPNLHMQSIARLCWSARGTLPNTGADERRLTRWTVRDPRRT
jgi:hypothetical protein